MHNGKIPHCVGPEWRWRNRTPDKVQASAVNIALTRVFDGVPESLELAPRQPDAHGPVRDGTPLAAAREARR
jgi:hypothetical protein